MKVADHRVQRCIEAAGQMKRQPTNRPVVAQPRFERGTSSR